MQRRRHVREMQGQADETLATASAILDNKNLTRRSGATAGRSCAAPWSRATSPSMCPASASVDCASSKTVDVSI